MIRQPNEQIMGEVARGQARLHEIPVVSKQADFTFLPSTPFGMFAIRQQYEAQVLNSSEPTGWRSHPFIRFLEPHLPTLDQALSEGKNLKQSIIHSDLFLENMIFTKPPPSHTSSSSSSSSSSPFDESPRLLGMIDFEEMGRGPRLLDICMTIVGCCYTSDNHLNVPLTRAFLRAYQRESPLAQAECRLFRAYLLWSLFAIAYWRWQNFNVVHPEPNARQDAYLQMQQRVEDLERPGEARTAFEQIEKELRAA